MAEDVDELFGAGEGTPSPRTGLALTLLGGGLLLAALGLGCTSAPGGLLVLMAWFVVDKETRRVDSGYLPADVAPRVFALQRMANASLVLVLILFSIQVALLCSGFYDELWGEVASWVIPVLRDLTG